MMKISIAKASCRFILILTLVMTLAAGCAKTEQTTLQSGAGNQEEGGVITDASRYLEPICKKADCESDVVYKKAEDQAGEMVELLLDVYQPHGDTETNRPALVILHAGGFIMGAKDAGIEPVLARDLAKKGYVTVPINYRLSENPITDWEVTLADATEDAAAAVDWLVKNSVKYGVDKDNIAILGYSAGGFLAVHLVYNNEKNILWNKECIVGVLSLSGGYAEVLCAADKNNPPCLCIHGTEDDTVAHAQSERLVEVLTDLGVEAQMYSVEGAGHDLYKAYSEVLDQITDFLYEVMVKKTPPQVDD